MGNSVIYRPAYDAEVEYLESTGTQWIDTGFTAEGGCIVEYDCIHKSYNGGVIVGSHNPSDNTDNGYNRNMAFIYNSESVKFNKCDDYESLPYVCELNTRHTWYFNTIGYNRIGKIDGNVVVNATTTSVLHPVNNIVIFFSQYNLIVSSGVIYNLKIKSADDVLVRDMIPVRIGSVGYMYDKVSKQLFANKGTGNFILGNDVVNAVIPQQRCVLYFGNQRSVGFERIYEEYEWIIGDQTAYIDVPMNLWQNGVDINIGKVDSQEDYFAIVANQGRLVIEAQPNNGVLMVVFRDDVGIPIHIADIAPYSSIPSEVNMQFYIDNGVAYCVQNGITHLGEEMSENQWNYNINSLSNLAKVSYLREYNKSDNSYIKNLVPCKLLQSIPAILDGNGIARQAGECGMWDKVSNRFYGNVANSGTFTVKGPKCYEEYDTLKTLAENTSSAPYGVAYFRFPNNIQLSGKVLTLKLGNTYRDYNVFGNTVDNASYIILIYRLGSITTIQERLGRTVLNSVSNSSSTIVEIDFDNNVVSVGTSTMNIQGTGYYTLGESNVSWGTEKYLKGLTISDVLNLVPCKLTHGIPASMDANGIARPAGTCGMWDKVNDVFYGNVANSGSFTVSND